MVADAKRLPPGEAVAGEGTRLFDDDVATSYRLDVVSSTAFSDGGARPRLAEAAWCRPTREEWTPEGDRMGTDDKIDNKAEELKGKVKEGVGEATDDRDLQTEGQADQAKGNLKQAGEKIKDTFKS